MVLLVGLAMFAVALGLWLVWTRVKRRRAAAAAATPMEAPPDTLGSYDDDSGLASGAVLGTRGLDGSDPPGGSR